MGFMAIFHRICLPVFPTTLCQANLSDLSWKSWMTPMHPRETPMWKVAVEYNVVFQWPRMTSHFLFGYFQGFFSGSPPLFCYKSNFFLFLFFSVSTIWNFRRNRQPQVYQICIYLRIARYSKLLPRNDFWLHWKTKSTQTLSCEWLVEGEHDVSRTSFFKEMFRFSKKDRFEHIKFGEVERLVSVMKQERHRYIQIIATIFTKNFGYLNLEVSSPSFAVWIRPKGIPSLKSSWK